MICPWIEDSMTKLFPLNPKPKVKFMMEFDPLKRGLMENL